MDVLSTISTYRQRIEELEEILEYPEVNVDYRFSKLFLDELNSLKKVVDLYDKYTQNNSDSIRDKLERLILSKIYDDYQGINISVNTKSQVLNNLYRDFFQRTKRQTTIKDDLIMVFGVNLYALYKEEMGIHQIIKDGKKQEIKIEVTPMFKEMPYDPTFVKIDYFHSSGAGGQNINKVETAVRMTHQQTGIVVTCQDERSQQQNIRKAYEIMQKKLIEYYEKEKAKKIKDLKPKKLDVVRIYDLDNDKITDLRLNKTYSFNDLKNYALYDIASEIALNGRN